ncbi:threonine--tRNA ligase, partial [Candidatus Woesearchaeota archaeon CG11_big_fil_rev_8_21_14_0_20_43_8]
MKILALHCDYVKFEAKKKAVNDAEELENPKDEVKECLVVFSAVEKNDENNPENVSARCVAEIRSIMEQVNADKVVLYPYVHLSQTPSSPAIALKVLKDVETQLKDKYDVHRSPFGWYKSFELRCKGHPLSELSRQFGPEGEVSVDDKNEALEAEKKLKSYWHVLDEEGNLHDLSIDGDRPKGFDFSKYETLKRFAMYEMAKVRVAKDQSPHIAYMKKLAIADYEPGSDPGHLRYYPKGRLIKGLLEGFVTDSLSAYGAMEMEAPIMYDMEHPSLKSYMHRFPARQYVIKTPNKKTFLRFAACFGQFLMMHDATVSYKNLPLRLFEMTRYSFRVEQRGELTGLRRLRAFTMPDCHAFCADKEQAKEEMKRRFKLSYELQKKIGINPMEDLEFAIRITKEFYDENKEFLTELVKEWGKPALIEMWNDRFFYFVMKYEWNFVDALDKASALTTDQMDVENAKRYDIVYTDKEGQKVNPLILHLSPSGAIERVMFALLEKAYFDEKKGKKPMLPVWLSPTQVRLICVSNEKHMKFAEKVADGLEAKGFRVDIDDHDDSIGKRIRNAEKEWTPYIVVIGDDEMKSGDLQVRIR